MNAAPLPSLPEASVSANYYWRPMEALPLLCAISSHDEEALRIARLVFGPWLVAPAEPFRGEAQLQGEAQLHWAIEADDDGGWTARGTTPESETLQSPTLARLVTQIEYAVMRHVVSHLDGRFYGLHGALLSRDGRGVIIVGPKEAGKSTLACALWRAEWQMHCDDFALVDDEGRAHPTARRVSLRRGSRILLGETLWQRIEAAPSTQPTQEGMLFHPHEIEYSSAPRAVELSAIVFLGRREASAAPAQLQRLEPAQAALQLLPYSTLLIPPHETELAPGRVDWGRALPRLAQLANRVSISDLGRGPIDAMVNSVKRLLDQSPS